MKLEVGESPPSTAPAPARDGFGLVPAAPGPHPGAHRRRRRRRVADLGARWHRAGQRRGLRADASSWALVGFVDTHAGDRTGSQGVPVPPPGGGGRLRGHDRPHGRPPGRDRARLGSARDVATIAAVAVTAISFHFLLALPDGRLHDSVRRTAAIDRLRRRARRRHRPRPATTSPSPSWTAPSAGRSRERWRSRRCGSATSRPSGTTGSAWNGSASA